MQTASRSALVVSAFLMSVPLAGAGPLHDAARDGDVEQIRRLVTAVGDLGESDGFGPPLHHAARHGHFKAVAALLEAGADANAPARDGSTALHWAAFRGDGPSIELLFAGGADPDIETFAYGTPLHVAAANGNVEVIALLITRKANLNAHDRIAGRTTPLHLAARDGHVDAASLLVDAGACLDCLSSESDTPSSLRRRMAGATSWRCC